MGFFAEPFNYPDYAEDYGFSDYFRYYCEIGAGISSMIEPILQVLAVKKVDGLIDVGCGVPFVVDFARTFAGIQAVGVDPSSYARKGSQLLGVPVDFALLGQGSASDGRRFGIVYSSEVIEHVPDPISFARALADHTADDGVLVLTTPSAEFVAPGTNRLDCLGTVWPGIHHAIYSANGLSAMLQDLGFSHVTVSQHRERLVAFASRVPFVPAQLTTEDHSRIRQYIATKADNPDRFGRSLASGNLFRLFRDAINLGQLDTARNLDQRLRELCLLEYGCDIHQYGHFCQEAKTEAQKDLFARWPYFTYVYAYYASALALHEGRYPAAADGFSAFAAMIQYNCFENALWWVEGANLYESALFHEALAILLNGRQDEAARLFQHIIARPATAEVGLASMAPRSEDLALRALTQLGVCKLQTGRFEQSIAIFDEALEWAQLRMIGVHSVSEILSLLKVAHQAAAPVRQFGQKNEK